MKTDRPFHLVFVSTVLTVVGVVDAQPAKPERSSEIPLARFVPPKVGGFAFFRELAEVDAAIQQTQAWRLFPLLTGESPHGGPPIDLRTQARALLGPLGSTEPEELANAEFAVVLESLGDWAAPVWLVRPARAQTLDRWFPGARRPEPEAAKASGFFLSETGMRVGIQGRVAALSRPTDDERLLGDVVRRMNQKDGDSLADQQEYRELLSFLPSRPIGVLYADFSPAPGFASASCRKAIVGLYSTEGRVDVAVRGKLAQPQTARSLGPQAVDALAALPASTVLAWTTTVPTLNSPDEADAGTSVERWVGRFAAFIQALRESDEEAPAALPPMGPRMVLAWDQEFDDGVTGPQLALLIESKNAKALSAELERMAERWLDSVEADPAALQRSNHLGANLTHLKLHDLAGGSALPLAGALVPLELSWSAYGEWLLLALSREHLQRLIDARLSLIPTLANVPDVQSLRRRRSNLAGLMVVQPDLASGVLQRWLERNETAKSPWLDPNLWREPFSDRETEQKLGIGMRIDQTPGMAVIARVYVATLAEGVLLPEDAIVGVDGELLDFAAPNADLRRRWAAPTPSGEHVFRVLRDGRLLEIPLQKTAPSAEPARLAVRPADAIRELAAIGRGVRFASWATHATDQGQYSALISLRLADQPSSPDRN